MRSAVRSESPVSMTTCLTPSACKSAMASRTPGLSGSSIPSTPTTVPSTARYSGDRPCICDSIRSLMSDSSCAPSSSNTKCAEPMIARRPSMDEAMPCATMYSTAA